MKTENVSVTAQFGLSPETETSHHASEVFLFYRDKQLFHIHTDRKVFEEWMEKSAWNYPRNRCEIVRYVPSDYAKCSKEAREKEITRLATFAECAQIAERGRCKSECGDPGCVAAKGIAAEIRALSDSSTLGNSK